MKVVFAQVAWQQLQKLDKSVQKRIINKLKFFSSQKNPLEFAEPIKDSRFGDWRFRIGEYRALFDCEGNTIFILKIGKRDKIYD